MKNASISRGRIALLFPYDNLERFVFLRDAFVMLVENGYGVDVYSPASHVPEKPIKGVEEISMFGRPEAFLFFAGDVPLWVKKFRKGGRPYIWWQMNVYRPLARRFFHQLLRKRHASSSYICMIGVDPEGLVSAAPLAQMLGVPFVFWSFELLFADEITGTKKKKLKEMEIVVNRQAEFSIIQDRWRGNALVQENGLRPESLIYIPNAPRGPARRQKSDYLHRRLGIDPGRRIILCAGMIDRWTMSMELVQVAAFWPEEFVLVMQSHTPRDGYWTQTYLNEVVRVADPSRVAISFDPIPSSDYRAMMDSADVGLVFYTSQTSSDTTQGRNIRLIGLSSGKLGGFLHSGLPLVVNDAVIGPKELVEQWGCGICVSRPEQIGAALETIFRDYDAYASNAVRCFNQELELGARFSKVIERLDGLLEQ